MLHAALCDFCHGPRLLRNEPSERLIFCDVCAVDYRSGDGCTKSPVVKRSIVLRGHKTSVSLEDEFWKGLKEIAGKRLMTLSTLVDGIDVQRQQGNLSSALASSSWIFIGAKSLS